MASDVVTDLEESGGGICAGVEDFVAVDEISVVVELNFSDLWADGRREALIKVTLIANDEGVRVGTTKFFGGGQC